MLKGDSKRDVCASLSCKVMTDNERITALEEKNAWLEAELERLTGELAFALDEIDKLKVQFKFLYSKVGDPYAVRPQNEEVPPPHY